MMYFTNGRFPTSVFCHTDYLLTSLFITDRSKTENNNGLWTDLREYHRRDAVMGDTLTLWCNTTESSGVVWTWNTTIGYFSYVTVNGSISGNRNIIIQFSVVNANKGEYSLRIYNVHPTDSGYYDCFKTDGKRIIGYYLVGTSKFLIIFQRN